MLSILLNTILPIFSIILLGYFLKRWGFIDLAYVKTANRLVYYVAIPVMIFREISGASFQTHFNPAAAACALLAMTAVIMTALAATRMLAISDHRRGTFVQSAFHGNIGYMCYAIAYYSMKEADFARMAILSSIVILGQNLLAVWVLSTYGALRQVTHEKKAMLKSIVSNPIIAAVMLGLIVSTLGQEVPPVVKKGLDILSGMAFPTALLLIGASLSFGAVRSMLREIVGIGVLKLLFLPLLGYALLQALHVPDPLVLPTLILLASPPATVTYVMALELGGHPQLAATSVSILTLLSAFSYSVILAMFSVR